MSLNLRHIAIVFESDWFADVLIYSYKFAKISVFKSLFSYFEILQINPL